MLLSSHEGSGPRAPLQCALPAQGLLRAVAFGTRGRHAAGGAELLAPLRVYGLASCLTSAARIILTATTVMSGVRHAAHTTGRS